MKEKPAAQPRRSIFFIQVDSHLSRGKFCACNRRVTFNAGRLCGMTRARHAAETTGVKGDSSIASTKFATAQVGVHLNEEDRPPGLGGWLLFHLLRKANRHSHQRPCHTGPPPKTSSARMEALILECRRAPLLDRRGRPIVASQCTPLQSALR